MTGKTRPGWQAMVVSLPDDLHAELKDFARTEDMTMAQCVRHAVRDYLRAKGLKS